MTAERDSTMTLEQVRDSLREVGLNAGNQYKRSWCYQLADAIDAHLAARDAVVSDGKAQWDELSAILGADGDNVDQVFRAAKDLASRKVAVPDGYVLVPIEPCWDQRNEGRELLIDGLENDPERMAYVIYKAMLNAAPSDQAMLSASQDEVK